MIKSKEDKIKTFDFDGLLTQDKNIFGLPFNADESEIIIIPVPWDVSVSYNDGTSQAPLAIKKASTLLDLYDYEYENVWKEGFFMLDVDEFWHKENIKLRKMADEYIQYISEGKSLDDRKDLSDKLKLINEMSEKLNDWLEETSMYYIRQGKTVAVIGGDHSSPLGLIRALDKTHSQFSILQFDAHADLRDGYEGFNYSHASIMHHSLKLKNIHKLVQLGVRDISCYEHDRIKREANRIKSFFDYDIKNQMLNGKTWESVAEEIVMQLDEKVYISFDIDALEPSLCPHTGTPVPGGLDFNQVCYLLKKLIEKKKKIIGFDLCEVSPGSNEWDANVGARILFKLCAVAAITKI